MVCARLSAYSPATAPISPIGDYFLKITLPSLSVKISSGSPSRIRSVLRISFGITTLPRSSILRTIPVEFMRDVFFPKRVTTRDFLSFSLYVYFLTKSYRRSFHLLCKEYTRSKAEEKAPECCGKYQRKSIQEAENTAHRFQAPRQIS